MLRQANSRILWVVDKAEASAAIRHAALATLSRLIVERGYEFGVATYGDGAGRIATLGAALALQGSLGEVIRDFQPAAVVTWGGPAEVRKAVGRRKIPWIAVTGSDATALTTQDFRTLEQATLVVAASRTSERALKGKAVKTPVKYISPGVDLDAFRPLDNRARLRREHGFDGAFGVGIWAPGAGLEDLQAALIAFARLRRHNPTAALVIVLARGQEQDWHLGDWGQRLGIAFQACTTDTLDAQGPAWRNELWNLLDVVMLPVAGWADADVMMEAMAAGRVIVAPDGPVAQEHLKGRGTIVSPPESTAVPGADAWAKALVHVADKGSRPESMAQKARAYAESNSSEKAAARWGKVLASLVRPTAVSRSLSLPDPVRAATSPARMDAPQSAQAGPAASAGKPRRITLLYPPGLGDALFAATLGYACAEAGHQVAVSCRKVDRAHRLTWPGLAKLGPLPLLTDGVLPGSERWSLIDMESFRWWEPRDMLAAVASEIGVRLGTTPRSACLRMLDKGIAESVSGQGAYGLIVPSGHSAEDRKQLTSGQLAAAAEAMMAAGVRPIVIGSERLEDVPGQAVNATGQTTLPELAALVAHAEIVVSADSGPLHLAQAYRRPTVALVASTISPDAFPDYRPILWLRAGEAARQVKASAVSDAVRRMLRAAHARWAVLLARRRPPQGVCGIVETAHIMADACGVPALFTDEVAAARLDAGVAEYIESDYDVWGEWRATADLPVLAMLHTRPGADVLEPAGWAGWSRAVVSDRPGAAVLNLPVPDPQPAAKTRCGAVIGWHGMPTTGKGLLALVEVYLALRGLVPDAELKIIASTGNCVVSADVLATLRDAAKRWPRARLLCRERWSREDLRAELDEVDVHVFLSTRDAEQSAAVVTAMGMGRPVVVSQSTTFDHVRAWCVEAGRQPETALGRLLTNPSHYAAAATRAAAGASYRATDIVAREYRACVVQMLLSRWR